MTDSLRAEQVREAVLEYLANRQELSYDMPLLLERLNKSRSLDFKIEPDDLTGALAFLEGREYIKHSFARLGATRFFQATSAGVLAHERGAIEEK